MRKGLLEDNKYAAAFWLEYQERMNFKRSQPDWASSHITAHTPKKKSLWPGVIAWIVLIGFAALFLWAVGAL